MPAGRPSKYKQLWLKHKDKLQKLYACGLTDKEVAEFLDIKEQTLNNWKKAHKEFFESLNDWKNGADSVVEKSLYQNAVDGNVTAQIFWLKNRKQKEWRDRQEVENTHKGDPDNPIKTENKWTIEFIEPKQLVTGDKENED